jgi:hypothetical protein
VILAAGVEPGQSFGRCPIPRQKTRFDWRAGKKEPRQSSGAEFAGGESSRC